MALCLEAIQTFLKGTFILIFSFNVRAVIATDYWHDDLEVGVRFSPLHIVQTGSGAHPNSYPVGTGGSFSEGNAIEPLNWPPTKKLNSMV
jgi:hypothetical protein